MNLRRKITRDVLTDGFDCFIRLRRGIYARVNRRGQRMGGMIPTRSDFEGDLIAARERADRELERSDSPRLWLGPLGRCRDCGYLVREVEPGRWICPCHEWSAAA